MNRSLARVLSLSIVGLIAAVLVGCGSSGPVAVSEADSGKPVSLAVGQTLEVTLLSNPTTGYSWQVADTAGGALRAEGEPQYAQDPGPPLPGKGGAEKLTFRAAKTGSGALVLEYRRPWEKDVAPDKTFEISVTVK